MRKSAKPRLDSRGNARPKAKPKQSKKKQSVYGKMAGETLGNLLGSMVPIPGAGLAGKYVGGLLGGKIGTMLGLGDYTVSKNTLITEGPQVPIMHSSHEMCDVIKREYLGDVISSPVAGGYKVTYYDLNPGLSTTIPWGSRIGSNFDEYQILGMDFEFLSNTSEYSPTSPNIGRVMMATSYNAAVENPFPNKIVLDNTEMTTSAKTNEAFHHPIECDPERMVADSLYIRSGAIPEGQDPRLYDWGKFAIATVGQPTPSQNCGELWVLYHIRYRKSTMRHFFTSNIPTDLFNTTSAGTNVFGTGVPDVSNSIGGRIGGNQYFFPPNISAGTYQFTDIIKSTAPLAINGYSFAGTNCSLVAQGLDPVNSLVQAPSNSTISAIWMVTALIQVNGPNASFALASTGTTTTSVLTVSQFDADIEQASP
jgi:hypothetical protein